MGRFHRWVKSKLEDILEKEHSTVKDRKIERDCHVPGTVLSSLRAWPYSRLMGSITVLTLQVRDQDSERAGSSRKVTEIVRKWC